MRMKRWRIARVMVSLSWVVFDTLADVHHWFSFLINRSYGHAK
jgi:hypothetical protein